MTFFFFFDLVLEDFREDADVISSLLFLEPLFFLDLIFLLRALFTESILFAGDDVSFFLGDAEGLRFAFVEACLPLFLEGERFVLFDFERLRDGRAADFDVDTKTLILFFLIDFLRFNSDAASRD